jgi:hypothetical protein
MSYKKNIVKYSRIYPCDDDITNNCVKKDNYIDSDLVTTNFVKSSNVKKKPSDCFVDNEKKSNRENKYSTEIELENDSDSDYYYYHYNHYTNSSNSNSSNSSSKSFAKKESKKSNSKISVYNDTKYDTI